MTRVQFYHNAADPLALTCELVERAYTSGRRVAVRTADALKAAELDEALWTFEPGSFIPHVQLGVPLSEETPVIVSDSAPAAAWPHQDVLFNLASDLAPNFAGFRTVIEIVGQNEEQVRAGRARWMQYRSLGLELTAFDAVRRARL